MKRFSLVLGLALALSLVFVGTAYANFGPHGGYISDTDACAGCHRAHSSFSTVTFDPKLPGPVGAAKPYALLVGSAATMTEFCEACHGDAAPGAATNVQSGRFDSGPSGDITLAAGDPSQTTGDDGGSVVTSYTTESTFNAPLNGGGFGSAAGGEILDTAAWETDGSRVYKAVTSTHNMEAVGVLWGAGSSVDGNTMDLTCTGCHDPHGSSNYRLLKDSVSNNVPVGGYNSADVPDAFVYSVETGYPTTGDGGWLKHQAGADQMAIYKPDYTAGSAKIAAGIAGKSMSAWCAGCHTTYDEQTDVDALNAEVGYDYSVFEGNGGVGSQVRHRHPVDITLVQGDGILQVNAQDNGTIDPRIPLEQAGTGNARQNHLGCITCHFAHGSDALMSGWSNAHLVQNASGVWAPERDATAGVEPDKGPVGGDVNNLAGTSALLRADNRGVCERCHNK